MQKKKIETRGVMTVYQFAKAAGVHTETIYRAIHKGKIKTLMIQMKREVIPVDELKKWQKTHENTQ